MDISLYFLAATVFIALVFDFVNGFHDAANCIATVVSTRVLNPIQAVIWAAFFSFIAMLIFAPKVADSVSKIVKIEMNDINFGYVIFSGLAAAIAWNLFTWRLALPTSSSHAIIGGVAGAGIAYAGWDALRWDIIASTAVFIVIAPLMGFFLGMLLMILSYWMCRNMRPFFVQQHFRKWQLLSAALYSIGHGANDAQKTMGIIIALFVAAGKFDQDTQLSLNNPETMWIILACYGALSLGTALGGWRIVKTMGMKIVKLKPIGGFCAEASGAVTLFIATHFGIPVSTTHTIMGSIIGVGTVSDHLTRIKWGIAANVLWAWLLTIPATALLAAAIFYVFRL